ncbi:MAG: pyridoxal-phosphate dependent enzyme [Woeseiaceae bacterium]|nr:pyridoxal-phosphate dependent enzyme [Woeseiaceae bacterium]
MAEDLTIDAIRVLRDELADDILRTPLLRCAALEEQLDNGTQVYAKMEFLQRTGTFKARGALAVLKSLGREQLAPGVTAVSAGNHAIATAFAARAMGTSAKVVMVSSANAARVDACRRLGAEIVFVDSVHDAFTVAEDIQQAEGRHFVHPYEGPWTAMGTGTVGLEIVEQCEAFDAVIVPIGGGGLMAGIATAVKQLRPESRVIGVEPEGAASMHRSFEAGEPRSIDSVRTIADSLGAPLALPYSFALCRKYVDSLAMVDDIQLRRAMGMLFERMKIAVEPACAASTAALFGPQRDELAGKTVVLVWCGSNIDWDTFAQQAIFGTDDTD